MSATSRVVQGIAKSPILWGVLASVAFFSPFEAGVLHSKFVERYRQVVERIVAYSAVVAVKDVGINTTCGHDGRFFPDGVPIGGIRNFDFHIVFLGEIVQSCLKIRGPTSEITQEREGGSSLRRADIP